MRLVTCTDKACFLQPSPSQLQTGYGSVDRHILTGGGSAGLNSIAPSYLIPIKSFEEKQSKGRKNKTLSGGGTVVRRKRSTSTSVKRKPAAAKSKSAVQRKRKQVQPAKYIPLRTVQVGGARGKGGKITKKKINSNVNKRRCVKARR
jgi:hypothetical protein